MPHHLNMVSSELPLVKLDTLVSVLQQLRLDAGFTQKNIATRLNLCRETISAIENAKPETLSTLQLEVVQRWWGLCRSKAQPDTRKSFALAVYANFGFDGQSAPSTSDNITLISQAAYFNPPCHNTTVKVS